MNVEVTKLPESRVALKVDLTPEEVNQALDRTYKQLVQRVNIPGFRKGKAPRAMVERVVGEEVFLHQATEEAIRWGYRRALDQSKVTPIDEAEIQAGQDEHSHLHSGEGFQFEATVSVRPEVRLPDYRAIHVERSEVEVTDADIDGVLNELREQNATLEPTVLSADVGMVVSMNIVGRVEGQEVINSDNADFELRDEENGEPDPVLPGLSKELIGVNRGEIREVALSLPQIYEDQEMAGKTLFLRILVKEIKRKVLPALDDDFAQSISELQSLDELRDRIRANLELERRIEADQQLVNEVIEAVTSRTFIEIPPVLVEEEIDRMLDDMQRAFERQHLSFQTYLETSGQSEAEIRQQMRETAVQNVKTSLVLGAVADGENIEVSRNEIDAALEEILRQSRTSDVERRRLRSSNAVRANIRSRIRRERAIRRLVEVVTGGEEVSSEATEAVVDQTAAVAADTEETVAVEVGS